MVVVVGAGARKLVNDLSKQQKLQVDYPRILVYKESSTKQYVEPASADSAALLLRQSLFLLLNGDLACSCSVALVFTTE
jgi:hypothetical protein